MVDEEQRRLHTAVLVGSATLSRRDQRARRKAAARRLSADTAARRAAQRDQLRAERAEAHQAQYLPASGETGPAALRTPVPFRAEPVS